MGLVCGAGRRETQRERARVNDSTGRSETNAIVAGKQAAAVVVVAVSKSASPRINMQRVAGCGNAGRTTHLLLFCWFD